MKLSNRVLGCAVEVHRNLGSGFLETVYERALEIELDRAGIEFVRQPQIEVWYHDQIIGIYAADFIVEDRLLLELKAQTKLTPIAEAQLLNYLRATGISVGLLLNFGATRLEIKRMVRNLDTQQSI